MDNKLLFLLSIATEFHSRPENKEKRFRKGGKNGGLKIPYIIHPLQVLQRIQRLGVYDRTEANFDVWKAALFHDVIEDTCINYEILVTTIGERAAKIVQELTHTSEISKNDYLASFATKSIEAVLIKIADRLCNVEDFCWDNPKYALKYVNKADEVFNLIDTRKQEIIDRFVPDVWEKVKWIQQICLKNVRTM